MDEVQATRVIVSVDAQVALDTSVSPPLGAGSASFAEAVVGAIGRGAQVKVDAVRSVSVATPRTQEGQGGRISQTWDVATYDVDGVELGPRRYNVEQVGAEYRLQLGEVGARRTVAVLGSRADAEAIGASWRSGALELGSGDGPRAREAV